MRILNSEIMQEENSLEFVQCLGLRGKVFLLEYRLTLFGIRYSIEMDENEIAVLKEQWKQGNLNGVYQILMHG